MRKVGVISTKGGTGKTTTVHNLSAALNGLRLRDPGVPVYKAERNSVLMVDVDPECNLSFITEAYGDRPSLYDVVSGDAGWDEARREVKPGLDIIPGDRRLVRFDRNRKYLFRLRESLRDLEGYDFIFVDCPPSLGYLTQSALLTTGEFFLPLQAEYLAMRNVARLMKQVGELKRYRRGLKLSGVILSLYNTRRKMSAEGRSMIEDHFGDQVFKTAIRNTVAITEAAAQHKDVIAYRSKSPGAIDFVSLAREVLNQTAKR